MADSDIQNKNAASEDDLGTVHRLVTQGIKMKIAAQVKKAKKETEEEKDKKNDKQKARGKRRQNQ